MDVRLFVEPHRGASYEDVLRCALAAEDSGITGFFCSDHYTWQGFGPVFPGPLDAWTTLAGLARDTKRVRLGTLLTAATFRHPATLAVQVAQVDAMSGGRVEFGLGAGWFEPEHTALGIGFPPLAERMSRLAEQLDVVTGLWAAPEEGFSYDGAYYRLENAPGLPKPRQRPRPPIIVGGSGPKRTPALAARFADEFNMLFPTVERFTEQRENVARACENEQRAPESLTLSVVQIACIGATDDEFKRRATDAGLHPDYLPPFVLGGTPAQVAERLAAFAREGASRVYLQVGDLTDLDHVALIGTQVVPALDELLGQTA